MRLVLALITAIAAPPAFANPSCAERIVFVQGVIDGDLPTGFIGKDVHDAMTKALAEAKAACDAGDVTKANAIVSATQERHGYPVR